MSKLENKIAVITGGNSGIGLATARLFKSEGGKVIINARNAQRLQETKADLGSEFDIFQADVSKIDELATFYKEIHEQHGKIDVLFLNAGIALFQPIEQTSEEIFDQLFNVNVKGVFFGVQQALPYLNEGASIILTTSIVNQKGLAGSSGYAATKAAVRNLAQTLSTELLGRGIRVNAIAPGPIETPIYSKMGMPEEQLNEFAGGIAGQVPMGRFGKAEEVASAALFFATSDSSYVVGTELEVDGGFATLM